MAESETPLDANRVFERLWVGGRPPFDRPLEHFDVLVLCAAELQPLPPELAFRGRVIRPRLLDHRPTDAEVHRAITAGSLVAAELAAGKRVLVTCRAGLNRSALVAGLALIERTRMKADNVLMLVRAARGPSTLFNEHFVALLRHAAARRARG